MKLWRTVFAILCFVFASGLVSVEQALASPLPVVAIHDSELTRALESMPASGGTPTGAGTTGNQWWKTEWHYFVMPDSVKEALRSDGTAFTVVGDSNILSGGLTNLDGSPKYPILISLASEAIDDNEIARLTNYVAGGGFLIVGSSAFTRNTNGTTRGDFAFGPQLGVHMVTPGLTNWGNDQFFTKVGNHRMVSHVPAGQLNWFMPLSADDIPLGVSGSHLPNSQHQVWQVQATDATVIANGGLGGSLFPYLLVKSYGKGYFIYHAAMQPLLGQGGYDSGMYAYVIFRRAIEWAFEAAKLPVTKVSPWPYAYDAAVIFRHDLEDIPNLINATETSAQFEKSVGAYGEYYFCTGVLRDNYTVSARSNEVASLQRAMSLYGAKIGSHNGGLKNANNLTLATNTYDYWHWGPDEALNVTGAGLNGYANGQSYALAAVSNSFADLRGWGLTNNNSELLYASPNHNSTREPSKQILQQLGVVASGAEKLSPFPHWTFSTQTPGKRFSFLTLPMSEWYVGAQVAQSMENHLTITDVGAAVDFYYNLGALINLYSHSSSAGGPSVAEPDGLGGVAVQTQPALQNFSVTNSVAKPRIWSTNSFGIYGWWLQRSNVVIVPSSSQVGNQMVTTVAITGAVSPQTAVEVFLPGNFASGVQVVTNGVAAGAGSFRVNGQVVKMLVGTSVTNVVVSFPVTPTAQGDAYTMFQNTTLAIPGPGVLTNDAPGLGGSNLTALLVSGPAHGSLSLSSNGGFNYTPAANFSGFDTFTYQANDGFTNSSPAVVTITVDLLNCVAPMPGLVGWWPGDGNANDIIGTNNGSLQGGATANTAAYVAQGFSFDGTNGFVQIPDSPALRPTNLTVEAWVLFDSLDSQGSANPGHQYIVFKQNSSNFEFEGFGLGKDRNSSVNPGGDIFYFNVGSGGGALVEVQSATIVQTGVWYHLAAVRGPDFIQLWVNGQLEDQAAVSFPQNYGTLPLYFGTSGQSFFDGKLKGHLDEVSLYNRALSSNEIASIYVATGSGKCKSLFANDDSYVAFRNTPLTVAVPGVLGNDAGAGLTAIPVSGPTNGVLTLNTNGSFIYTPNNGFVGADGFTYQANNGQTNSNIARVSLTVTPVPLTASNDTYSVVENTTLAVGTPGVLGNDTGGTGSLTALLVSGPANGTLTLNANGAFSYSPSNNFTGSDSFNYRATDGSLTSGVATVTVAVTSSGALFFDDFTRSGNSSNSLLPWIYQDGTWAITNNQLQGVGNGAPNNYGHVYISNSWTDYSIQAQLQFPSTNIWAAGVGGRLEPTTGAHYAAWVFPEGSQGPNYPPTAGATGTPVLKLIKFQVWQASGSEFTVLQQVNLPPVGTNAHTVRLTFQGTNLVVSFDGSLVISTNDPAAYASGGVTLDAVAYPTPEIVNFDNVVVASLEQGSRITSVSAANGVATVTWTSQAGKTYRLLYKDNLTVANWSVVPGDVAATGATASKTNSVGNVAQRFYRVLLLN